MNVPDLASKQLDCRVTLLTAARRGAIATISVEGKDAFELVRRYFHRRRGRDADPPAMGRIVFGDWRYPQGTPEEVVLCRRDEFLFEVNCHGGRAASEAIIQSLLHIGAVRVSTTEWLNRGESDPIQRAAWSALSQSVTTHSARILLDQYRGALTHAITGICSDLKSQMAGENNTRFIPMPATDVELRLTQLLRRADVGLHLTNPWHVVFAGPPNVGKSSLMNAVLGYQRSLVFDEPGTTRDVLTAVTAVDGWLLEFSDTAGLRVGTNADETEGVSLARGRIQGADLVIQVEDLSAPPVSYEMPPSSAKKLVVANKCDLPAARELPQGVLRTSAVAGTGIETLLQLIVQQLIPDLPQPGEAVPFTRELVAGLQHVLDSVRCGNFTVAGEWADRLLRGESSSFVSSGVSHPSGPLPTKSSD